MQKITVRSSIKAPVEDVFRIVSDIREFASVIPQIVDVEFLTDQQVGEGTRFRETRAIRGKKATTELEVTEYFENSHVRLVSDTHGTIWDSTFRVTPTKEGTDLSMTMEARAYKFLPRILNVLAMKAIVKAIEADMQAVKEHCEAEALKAESS